MPSTAFGPLVEPGWPDLKGPDMGQKFLAGAALGAEMNRRKQALENQLALYALKAQQMENQNSIRERQFELATQVADWKHEKDVQGLNDASRRIDLARDGMDLREQAFNFKTEKERQRQEGVAGIFNALSELDAEGIKPGDPNYEREVLSRTAPFAATAPSAVVNNVQRNALNKHNDAIKQSRIAFDSEQRQFYNDIGRVLYGGNTLTQNLDPILHPEKLPDETSGGIGGWSIGPYKNKPTGNKIVTGPDGKKATVSMKDINDLKKRWDAITARRNSIPSPVDRADLGVFKDQPITLQQKAERALIDPNASPEAKAAAHKYLGY